MNRRAAAWLAWSLWGLAMVLMLCTVAFTIRYWSALAALGGDLAPNSVAIVGGIAMVTAFSTVGALIVSRQPTNLIGWIFLGFILHFVVGNVVNSYAVYALRLHPRTLAGGVIAAWWADAGNTPIAFFPFIFLFLLFPNGRLLSRRWRVVAWLALVTMFLWLVPSAMSPGPLRTFPFVMNPFGVAALRRALELLIFPLLVATIVCGFAGAFSLILRFRRSRGEERQQLKWFASASAFVAIAFACAPFLWSGPPSLSNWLWPLLFSTAITSLPVAAGIAILKYRLYDIDVIVNRTLVYGMLTALLALLYLGSVVLLRQIFSPFIGGDNQIAIVGSTLVIAALFQPLRRRIQAIIDRRFYRRKYDAQQTLQAFSARLREETDLAHLSDDLIAVVQETLQPQHVSLWLREAEVKR